MTNPLPSSSPSTVHAADAFVRRLMDAALITRVDRVETHLLAGDADIALAADRVFTAAWDAALGPKPHHEVIWTWRQGRLDAVKLCAFDLTGRALLHQRYAGEVQPNAEDTSTCEHV